MYGLIYFNRFKNITRLHLVEDYDLAIDLLRELYLEELKTAKHISWEDTKIEDDSTRFIIHDFENVIDCRICPVADYISR